MTWTFPLINLAHNFAALILFTLFIYCVRHRQRPVARALGVFFFFSGFWALTASLIFWAPDLESKILLNRLKMISPTVLPLSFLAMAASLSHWRIPNWLWAVLSIVPMAGIGLLMSSSHGLYITDYSLLHLGDAELLKFSNGPWFPVANTQARLLALASLFIISRSNKGHNTHRLRVWLINISLILPFIADSVAVLYWQELRYAQIVPTVLVITGIILFFAVFKYHALEVVPYARSLVVDQIDDPFLVVHNDQTLLDFNQAARKFFSLSDRSIGEPLQLALAQSPSLLKVLSDTSLSLKEWEDKARQRWFSVSQQTITDKNKKTLGQLLHLRDQTMSKKIETQLREISETKSKFLGIFAHDLVGNVSGLSILSDQLALHHNRMKADELSSSLELLKDSSHQLKDFMEQLLAWAKRNLNVIEIKKTNFSWEQATKDVLQTAHPLLVAKKLEVNCSKEEVQFYADLDMIKLVIRNLLANAINHSSERGIIILKASQLENSQIQVQVINQGAAIAPEQLKSLFELSSRRQSQGLGLILCKDFIEAHNGEIGVESQSGETRFYFNLPVC